MLIPSSEDITSDVFSICLDILYVVFKVQISQNLLTTSANSTRNGDEEIRTLDPLLARQVLSQLSYIPIWA